MYSQYRAALFQLVGTVHAELNLEDGALLSDSALMMIFDSWRHSVHDDGMMRLTNDHASEEEVSLAVLGAGLSNAQRESLQQIYKFTHNKVPQLNYICLYDIHFISIAYYSFNNEICLETM